MNRDSSPSVSPPSPPLRSRGILLLGLVLLGGAGALFLVRGPLMMSAPMCLSGRWGGCFGTFNGVVLMTVVTLPLAGVVAWGLARWRRRAGVASGGRISVAEVGMVHGTLPFLWMTMMPGGGAGVVPPRLSLVPLRDLVTMGPLGIGGNLLVFASLGFFAPVRWAALASVPRILALGAGCSVLVETAQYVLWLDRVSSVDDVLVNATGAVLAGLASRRWWRGRTPAASASASPAPDVARVA
ncbi:VanZ family protein [Streptomyces sp. NPDC058486]|uniref:VanZ family protein n=1 Tax=unclassified Streptomyces TaxID=2593676 RepID=UPI00365C3C7B